MNSIIMEVTVGPTHTIRLRGPQPFYTSKEVFTHYRKCGQAVRAFMKQENPRRRRRAKHAMPV